MARVRIVTDASAHLQSALVAQKNITVLPLEVLFDGRPYACAPEDDPSELFQLMSSGPARPAEATVPEAAFESAFRRLNRETEDILVLTSSSKLCGAFGNARSAAQAFMGRCEIVVMDSRSTSWALGYLVTQAATAAANGHSLDAIVRLVRGILPHLYVVFFVERLDYLEQGGRIGVAQAVLGTMLRIKPLLLVEQGDIMPMEKVRTRSDAIGKLTDFVAEFASVQDVVMLRSPMNGTTDEKIAELAEQLGEVLSPGTQPVIQYDLVVACHLGPEAVGVTVFEGM